jgi:hypothetical protein
MAGWVLLPELPDCAHPAGANLMTMMEIFNLYIYFEEFNTK